MRRQILSTMYNSKYEKKKEKKIPKNAKDGINFQQKHREQRTEWSYL